MAQNQQPGQGQSENKFQPRAEGTQTGTDKNTEKKAGSQSMGREGSESSETSVSGGSCGTNNSKGSC